jgi:hypothetical protein
MPAPAGPAETTVTITRLDAKGRLPLSPVIDATLAAERDGGVLVLLLPDSGRTPQPGYDTTPLRVNARRRLWLSPNLRAQFGLADQADVLVRRSSGGTLELMAASRLDPHLDELFPASRHRPGGRTPTDATPSPGPHGLSAGWSTCLPAPSSTRARRCGHLKRSLATLAKHTRAELTALVRTRSPCQSRASARSRAVHPRTTALAAGGSTAESGAVPPRVSSGRSRRASDQPAKSAVSQRCCWSYTTAIPARLNRVLSMFW